MYNELLVPSKLLIKPFRTPYDKTYLFLFTLGRCFIYLVVFFILLELLKNFSINSSFISIILGLFIFLNLLSLIFVIMRKPYEQNYLSNSSSAIPQDLSQINQLFLDASDKDNLDNIYPEGENFK